MNRKILLLGFALVLYQTHLLVAAPTPPTQAEVEGIAREVFDAIVEQTDTTDATLGMLNEFTIRNDGGDEHENLVAEDGRSGFTSQLKLPFVRYPDEVATELCTKGAYPWDPPKYKHIFAQGPYKDQSLTFECEGDYYFVPQTFHKAKEVKIKTIVQPVPHSWWH